MNHWLILFFSFLTLSPAWSQERDVQMESLLSGDLDQWEVPEDNIWWSLNDGILEAKSDPEKTGSILWTKKVFTDFTIELEFRFGKGTIDSGIFMRGDTDRDVQIQIGISGSLQRDMTGSPYVPGLGYPVEASGVAELLKAHQWNSLKAKVHGNAYTAWLNGKEVMQYSLDTADPQGPIGLQLHPGNDMTIQFRNIRVARQDRK
jgi:hypothetical protein